MLALHVPTELKARLRAVSNGHGGMTRILVKALAKEVSRLERRQVAKRSTP